MSENENRPSPRKPEKEAESGGFNTKTLVAVLVVLAFVIIASSLFNPLRKEKEITSTEFREAYRNTFRPSAEGR